MFAQSMQRFPAGVASLRCSHPRFIHFFIVSLKVGYINMKSLQLLSIEYSRTHFSPGISVLTSNSLRGVHLNAGTIALTDIKHTGIS